MPEPKSTGNQQVIAVVMVFSAITLALFAYLTYAGIVPVPEDTRGIVASVSGVAAFADLLAGIWFFRKGQSS